MYFSRLSLIQDKNKEGSLFHAIVKSQDITTFRYGLIYELRYALTFFLHPSHCLLSPLSSEWAVSSRRLTFFQPSNLSKSTVFSSIVPTNSQGWLSLLWSVLDHSRINCYTLVDTVIDWVRVTPEKEGPNSVTRGRDAMQTGTTDVLYRWSGKVVES